jgi:hypothetical protein
MEATGECKMVRSFKEKIYENVDFPLCENIILTLLASNTIF